MVRHFIPLFIALLLCSSVQVHAQQAPSQPERGQGLRIEDLPPPIRLGARAETVRRSWPVLPVVVIVFDEASYLEAIAQWSAAARYPVLIDDGTAEAREDIARFVRGFEPTQVVRWSADRDPGKKWTGDRVQRRKAIESVVHRVWSHRLPGEGMVAPITTTEGLIERWRQIGVTPPGVVLANVNDGAWPAAVALAAGRLQPIAWVSTGGSFGGTFSASEFDGFADEVEEQLEGFGLSWREIGDDIDALTVCLNIPAKVQADESNVLAMTDMLGRHRKPKSSGDGEPANSESEQRWAWAGQIAGSQSSSAYMAMCSLFLAPTTAWLFDGYPDEEPWSKFDVAGAADFFRKAEMKVMLDDTPRQDIRQWRQRTSGGIEAAVIAVNTKGMGNEFHLQGGRCRPGDVPHLNIPSFVYFVHSFSASSLGARETVGARWLERGAHAYCGSVHEPTLFGFIPTPVLAARLVSAYPWGAAVRMDDGPPWKIAVIGDPLMALGPPAQRVADAVELPLPGADDLESMLRSALEERNYADVLRALALLGRDEHAARLAAAVLAEEARAISSAAADAALMPVFRKGNLDTLTALYKRLTPEDASAGWRRDALWHKAHPHLASTRSRELLDLLAEHLRPDQIGRDAAELASPMQRLLGAQDAVNMLQAARDATATQSERAEIDKTLEQMRNRLGRPRR